MSRILGLLSLAMLVLAPLGGRLHVVPLRIALLMVPLAALIAVIAVLLGAFRLLRKPSPDQRSAAIAGLVAGLVPVAFMVNVAVQGHGLPMIHNITTDLKDPPTFTVAPTLATRVADNSLEYDVHDAPLQAAAYPDVRTLATAEDPAHAFEHAKAIATKLGWEIYSADTVAGNIEAVDTTRLWGFKDDIVIRIRARGTGSIVDLRSVSRVGHGDMGANAKRIRKFIAAFTS